MTTLNDKPLPLLLLLAAVGAAFAWVFLHVLDLAESEKASALTLQTDEREQPVRLELTKQLSSIPASGASPARSSSTPALWWPALLFALPFCTGWFFRHGLRSLTTEAVENRSLATESDTCPLESTHSDDSSRANPRTLTSSNSVPDLTLDFPWDDSAVAGLSSLSAEERIARLEKQNASKAEIIKALEKLVTENREKWLHQDETEARLNHHISKLSQDLQVAIHQLQRLQEDTQVQKVLSQKDVV